MKRVILACIAAAVLLPVTAEGTALADGAAMQDTGQSAGSSQIAASAAESTQVKPSNENISVRVMSPGSDGDVTQINSSAAASAAGNDNATSQAAAQSGAAQQAVGQGAHNAQAALSAAKSTQVAPSNENISVRIMSPGDSGDVKQVNASSAQSVAGNQNGTTQAAEQSASGGDAPAAPRATQPEEQSTGKVPPPKREPCAPACGGGKPTVQAIGQDVVNKQVAASAAISLQDHPVNANHGGSGGSVTQVNGSAAKSAAGNANWTDQKAVQSAGRGADMVAACTSCGHTGTVVQAIGQRVKSEQLALSKAVSAQIHPVNLNVPVVHKGVAPSKPKMEMPAPKPYEPPKGEKPAYEPPKGEEPAPHPCECEPPKGEEPEPKPYEPPKGEEPEPKPYEPPKAEAPAPAPAGDVRQLNGSAALSAGGNQNGTSQTAWQFGGRWPVSM